MEPGGSGSRNAEQVRSSKALSQHEPPATTSQAELQSLANTKQVIMAEKTLVNELYLVVMPQISLSPSSYGKVDEVLTLLPDRKFASEFTTDAADGFILVFKHREKYFVGGGVIGYSYHKIP